MLSQSISVHDILDVEAFVTRMIQKTRLRPTQDEREDLVAEGIAIVLKLSKQFKPRMDGYAQDGSFAGYCSIYLPKKLTTAWHQWHPEHIIKSHKQADGRVIKRYVYGDSPASLDEQLERNPDLDSVSIRTPGNFVRG